MKPNKPRKQLNDYAKYSSIAFQMIAIILLGIFGGYELDKWLTNGKHYFVVVFSMLSVILSIYYVTKDLLNNKK